MKWDVPEHHERNEGEVMTKHNIKYWSYHLFKCLQVETKGLSCTFLAEMLFRVLKSIPEQ